MCMFLCSDDPLESDDSKYGKYHAFVNQWQVGMIHAPGADPLVCCAACVCVPCAQYYLRDKASHWGSALRASVCFGGESRDDSTITHDPHLRAVICVGARRADGELHLLPRLL
jgi:hypothetical protein